METEMLTTEQLLEQYEVLGFALGQCVVKRKSDGAKGTFFFENIDGVRMYHSFWQMH